MSYTCYNNSFFEDSNISLSLDNRAFKYGDGLFETIIFDGIILRFWHDHFSRLAQGLDILKLQYPENFELELKHNILSLVAQNQHLKGARVRLQVWRKDGGLYTPTDNGVNYVIQSFDYLPQKTEPLTLAICKNMNMSYSTVSHLKTCNSIAYIVASLEKQERNIGDLVLLDTNGNISEATSSNIFWVQNEQWYTPSLRTGCVAGVMRKNMIKILEKNGKPVLEIETSITKLHNAQGIFLSNVTGIRGVSRFEDLSFDKSFVEENRKYLERLVGNKV